jgi:membrane-associated protease RseP (regulator of RpoE activity)
VSSPGPAEAATPVRPKFQHNYPLAIGLFLLTLATTTLMGGLWVAEPTPVFTWQQLVLRFVSWEYLAAGMRFSIPLMFILLCHEMGHYLACRRYRVDATLPYFLPAPLGVGTFGAFMKIKDPIPSKPILFDIGVAGPLAGFMAALPFAVWGIYRSTPAFAQGGEGMITRGEPLLFKLLTWSLWRMGEGATLLLHPFAFAAWIGMLATMLNLLPFGQLDGGHILYALLGRHQRRIALPLFLALLVMGWFWWVWLMWAAFILFMGPFHPRLWDEPIPLDRKRKLLGAVAGVVFILTFMPVPVR